MNRLILSCLVVSTFLFPSLARSAPSKPDARARKPAFSRLASVVLNGKQRARALHKMFWRSRFSTARSVLNKNKLSFVDMKTILKAHKAWKNPDDIVLRQKGGWSWTYYTHEYRDGDPSAAAHQTLRAKYGADIASKLMKNDVTTPRGFSYEQVKNGPSQGGAGASQVGGQQIIVGAGLITSGLLLLSMFL